MSTSTRRPLSQHALSAPARHDGGPVGPTRAVGRLFGLLVLASGLAVTSGDARAEAPHLSTPEVEQVLAQSLGSWPSEPKLLDARRFQLARLRLGLTSDCSPLEVRPSDDVVLGYFCRTQVRVRSADLDRREAAGEAITVEDELRVLLSECVGQYDAMYQHKVTFQSLPYCAYLGTALATAQLPAAKEAEARELTAFLQSVVAALAGRVTSFEHASAGDVSPSWQASQAAERKAWIAAWDSRTPLAKVIIERLGQWAARAARHERMLFDFDDGDLTFCRTTLAEAFQAALSSPKPLRELERQTEQDLTLMLARGARNWCHRGGAFGDALPKPVQFDPDAVPQRRGGQRKLLAAAPNGWDDGVVARVSELEGAWLVSFAPVTDTREVLTGCTSTDKIDRVVRSGATFEVTYQQRCRSGGTTKSVYGTGPIIVDEATAKTLKPGMIVIVEGKLDFAMTTDGGKPTGKTFIPVRASVEWAFPKGSKVGVVDDRSGLVPVIAWGVPVARAAR